MQKAKTFLRTFLIVLMMTTATAAWAEEFTQGNLTFTYTPGEKVCSVTDCDESVSGSLDIPKTITVSGKEYWVVEIGFMAFKECCNLTNIMIPNSVQLIHLWAFDNCIYNHRTTKTNQKYPSVNL